MMQVKQKQPQPKEPTSLFTPCGKYINVGYFCLVTCKKVVFGSPDYFDYLTTKSDVPDSGILAGFK